MKKYSNTNYAHERKKMIKKMHKHEMMINLQVFSYSMILSSIFASSNIAYVIEIYEIQVPDFVNNIHIYFNESMLSKNLLKF